MEIVHTIKDLQAGLSALRAQGKKVGLVPTMVPCMPVMLIGETLCGRKTTLP